MTCLHKLIVAQAIFQGKFLSNRMLNSLETTPTDRHRLSKRKKNHYKRLEGYLAIKETYGRTDLQSEQ